MLNYLSVKLQLAWFCNNAFVAVLLRCVILMLLKDFPHKSGCAKGDLIAAPSLSPLCAVKHKQTSTAICQTFSFASPL